MSKEQFKQFIKTKPELADYVNNGDMTWQKFYELYDIYGEDDTIWNQYKPKTTSKINFFENLDIDKMEENLKKAEKALGFFSELTKTGAENISKIKTPTNPTPITKFFGD